jgi:DMSO/TMAO reductase YedYZ heme-binding membrane subunit
MGDRGMNVEWIVTRGSGVVAFALLAVATIWGLLLSTGVLRQAVKPKGLTFLHESLGLASLLATGVHMTALGLDEFIEFGPQEIFVPGASAWRPLATALGVMAFYGVAVVSMSFYVKKWIGNAAWRTLHYLSFGTFLAALVHGVMAGTDRSHPVVFAMYAGAGAVVALLLVVRVATAFHPPAPARRAATVAGSQ